MATLSETAYYTRQGIKFGTIVLVCIIVLRLSYMVFQRWWELNNPPPLPPAEVLFGVLPKIPFPQQDKPPYTFTLETVSGTTGEFDNLQNVYFMPVKPASLLALDRATEVARRLGFLFEPQILSETVYKWTKDDPFPTSFQIDTLTDHFEYKGSWEVRPDLLNVTRAPSEAESISLAKNWLSVAGRLPSDLSSGDALVSYLKISGTQIVPALSQADSQIVRVDLFRAPVNELKVWTSNTDQGIVSVTFIPSQIRNNQLLVIDATYRYYSVELEQKSTYPVITSKSAWEAFIEGKGYYAHNLSNDSTNVIIRKVTLGYYDPPKAGYFLQPIYIFEGDNDFVGFYPAVDPAWVQPTQ
jgi:hypothetical protein